VFSEYFDPGYFADGYWSVSGGAEPGSVELRLVGSLAGATGRVLLELAPLEAEERPVGGGGGSVRRGDVERMERYLRSTRLRVRGDLEGVAGRLVAGQKFSARLSASLDGAGGRVELVRRFTAEVLKDEDEEWLLWLT
jgi:hypothetical protein